MAIVVNGKNWVDNRPIREAVEHAEAEGLPSNQIAKRLGWWNCKPGKEDGDISRMNRRLGRMGSGGRLSHALRYDLAVAIIRAIDRDPVDFDL